MVSWENNEPMSGHDILPFQEPILNHPDWPVYPDWGCKMFRRCFLFASLFFTILIILSMKTLHPSAQLSGAIWAQSDFWSARDAAMDVHVLEKPSQQSMNERIRQKDASQPNLPVASLVDQAAENLLVEGMSFDDQKTSQQTQTPETSETVPQSDTKEESTANPDTVSESRPIETASSDPVVAKSPETSRESQPVPTAEPTPEPTPEPVSEAMPESDLKSLTGLVSDSSQETTSAPVDSGVQDAILSLTNEVRQESGLPALTSNGSLNQLAMQRASELVSCTSHQRPDGRAFYTILTDHGITATACAENFACATANAFSASDIFQSWMASTPHQANILSTTCSQIGIGYVVHENKAYYVQLFVG